MILRALGSAYGAAGTWRRRWYAQHPSRRAALSRPVISIGNLSVGGSGKTPLVAHVAALLLEAGERPAILTRGYGRQDPHEGVTLVSDLSRVLAGVAEAGDEPLMLARALPGVPVLVGADRFRSGRFAEARFGVTVHLLDDGFQHLQLTRAIDLLLVAADDLRDRVLPAGRLREPLAAARAADALVVADGAGNAAAIAGELGVDTAFALTRSIGDPAGVSRDQPVFALAAIARPDRFFDDLRRNGWQVAGTAKFRDHHRFSRDDLARVAARAQAAGARIILTTAKDFVRLEGLDAGGVSVHAVPLTVNVEPAAAFREWLLSSLRRSR